MPAMANRIKETTKNEKARSRPNRAWIWAYSPCMPPPCAARSGLPVAHHVSHLDEHPQPDLHLDTGYTVVASDLRWCGIGSMVVEVLRCWGRREGAGEVVEIL